MIGISTNELRYLRDVFAEVKDNIDHDEIDNAIEMIDGLIEESRKVQDLTIQRMLEINEKLLEIENV